MKPSLEEIIIRTELKPGDIGYITYLHGKVYSEEYQFGLTFETYVATGLVEFLHQYNPQNQRIWVCEHNGKIVGFILLMNRGNAAQLRYFILLPEYRGIGLGNKLMGLYMDFLTQCGYKSSYLWTTDGLPAAAHLYIKHGFKLTEEKPSAAFGKPLKELRYDLNLVD